MICPTCRGRGAIPIGALDDEGFAPTAGIAPCPQCGGSGTAYCCDDAGAEPTPSYICPGCRAVSYHPIDIEERYCGRCHQFADDDP